MVRYFVIAADGQKYGPADVATLNDWITQGRLLPTTQLQSEADNELVAASGVPALKFQTRPVAAASAPPQVGPANISPPAPAPAPAPMSSNPYDTPRPGLTGQQPAPFSSNYPRGMSSQPKPASMSGPVLAGWLTTLAAPVAIYFISYGLILIIWGFRAGFALYQSGSRTQGAIMIGINCLSAVFWLAVRVFWMQRISNTYP